MATSSSTEEKPVNTPVKHNNNNNNNHHPPTHGLATTKKTTTTTTNETTTTGGSPCTYQSGGDEPITTDDNCCGESSSSEGTSSDSFAAESGMEASSHDDNNNNNNNNEEEDDSAGDDDDKRNYELPGLIQTNLKISEPGTSAAAAATTGETSIITASPRKTSTTRSALSTARLTPQQFTERLSAAYRLTHNNNNSPFSSSSNNSALDFGTWHSPKSPPLVSPHRRNHRAARKRHHHHHDNTTLNKQSSLPFQDGALESPLVTGSSVATIGSKSDATPNQPRRAPSLRIASSSSSLLSENNNNTGPPLDAASKDNTNIARISLSSELNANHTTTENYNNNNNHNHNNGSTAPKANTKNVAPRRGVMKSDIRLQGGSSDVSLFGSIRSMRDISEKSWRTGGSLSRHLHAVPQTPRSSTTRRHTTHSMPTEPNRPLSRNEGTIKRFSAPRLGQIVVIDSVSDISDDESLLWDNHDNNTTDEKHEPSSPEQSPPPPAKPSYGLNTQRKARRTRRDTQLDVSIASMEKSMHSDAAPRRPSRRGSQLPTGLPPRQDSSDSQNNNNQNNHHNNNSGSDNSGRRIQRPPPPRQDPRWNSHSLTTTWHAPVRKPAPFPNYRPNRLAADNEDDDSSLSSSDESSVDDSLESGDMGIF